jgi:hypothetical protein
MPAWKSIEERLADQFYAWELRGRGWDVWPAPVHLEPAFLPFPGHSLPYEPAPDDGRRPTLFSRIADRFRGRGPTEDRGVQAEEANEPLPRFMEEDDLLEAYRITLQEGGGKRESAVAFLGAIRDMRYPLSFEIVGTAAGILIQFVARHMDVAQLRAQLRIHLPECVLHPLPDVIDRTLENERRSGAVIEIALRQEFMRPLRVAKSLEPDPLATLVGALSDLEQEELAAFQVLFEPAQARWAESMLRAVTAADGSDFFRDAPEIARGAKQKALQPLYGVCLRLLVLGPDSETCNARLRRFGPALEQLENPEGNEFFVVHSEERYDELDDFLLRQSHRSGMLLSQDELVTLVHLPSQGLRSPRLLVREARRSKPLPVGRPTNGLHLGENIHAGRVMPVYLDRDDERRHTHVVGATGTGKSNLLLRLAMERVNRGDGLAVLDPHGDLTDDILARLPENRMEDVILFDPADIDRPVGMNVLAAHSELERTLLASDLVAIFRRFSTSWGDQMNVVLGNAIQAILESPKGGTLADLRRFLVEPEYRRAYLASGVDPETVYYWTREFPLLKGRPEGSILTRLDAFLRPKPIRRIVTDTGNRLDFRAVMDERRIFLAKLSQGAIGEENAGILGSLLISKFQQIALSRQDTRESHRPDFAIVIDEFQHFVTPSMATLLSGARKYRVSLTLAHQELRQLQARDPEVLSAVL